MVMGLIVDVDALFSLTQLTHLNELSLTNGPALSLDFFASVVPILQSLGQRLGSLTLTRFDCVDLFGKYCSSSREEKKIQGGRPTATSDLAAGKVGQIACNSFRIFRTRSCWSYSLREYNGALCMRMIYFKPCRTRLFSLRTCVLNSLCT